ncbi:MAG TPA: DUF6748 domain-containing protein, partial [Pyrinomonadaceae bacterium]|nr:DUF6748 domain-containing protein [Pyrinomonadaceae bacterium]
LRAALVGAVFAALTLSSGASPHVTEIASSANAETESESASPAPVAPTPTFYRVRPDLRRCVSPLCGGYFVKSVNMSSTRCADGRFRPECYVAEIDGNAQAESDGAQVVRGEIVARRYERFGNLGALRLSESWKSLGANQPAGTFYLVRDRGVRCIAFPCPTHHEAKLNSSFSRNIAGVNLEAAGLGDNASVVNAAMTGPEGVIVAGQDSPVKGPGGRSFELKATQVYVRNKLDSGSTTPDRSSMKPCIKTGCSSQICADHNVVSTCEFRPEYACYQKATCARQANGNCGFTKTPELTECLGRK